MTLIDFKIEHFDQLEFEESAHLRRSRRNEYAQLPTRGSAFTLWSDGPVACGGVAVHWPGVGELWMLRGSCASDHPVSMVKAARGVVEDAVTRFNLHRIQAAVEEQDRRALMFIESLGFVFEGRLRAYGPGKEDHLMFARVS